MSIIRRARKQKAVWWPIGNSAVDAFGKQKDTEPVEIDCRWDDHIQEFINSKGTLQKSKAVLMVDDNITFQIGDKLRLGTLSDLEDPTCVDKNNNVWPIEGIMRHPNIRNTEVLKMLLL